MKDRIKPLAIAFYIPQLSDFPGHRPALGLWSPQKVYRPHGQWPRVRLRWPRDFQSLADVVPTAGIFHIPPN